MKNPMDSDLTDWALVVCAAVLFAIMLIMVALFILREASLCK